MEQYLLIIRKKQKTADLIIECPAVDGMSFQFASLPLTRLNRNTFTGQLSSKKTSNLKDLTLVKFSLVIPPVGDYDSVAGILQS